MFQILIQQVTAQTITYNQNSQTQTYNSFNSIHSLAHPTSQQKQHLDWNYKWK